MVDQEEADENAHEVGTDHGDVAALFGAQLIHHRLGDGNVVHEQRVVVADAVGQGSHFVGAGQHEVAQKAVLRHAEDVDLVLGEVLFFRAAVACGAIGVKEHARPLGEEPAFVLRSDLSYGKPSGDERIFRRFDCTVENGDVRSAQQCFRDADAEFSLLRLRYGNILPR